MSLSENLYNLGALLKTNLETKGISGLTGSEGLTTLANKILDIEGSGSSSKSVVACVTGNSVTLGSDGYRWLPSIGSVVIDWGDGTSDTINNPSTSLSHTYTNANGHLIAFNGNITSLGDSCFYQCSGLTSIIIPDSITNLGEGCFAQCSGLTNIIIPNSVTSLGNVCFSNCSGLTSIIIPSSVTNIGGACFNRCFGLTSVIIPDSITSIEESCFSECSSLTSVVIPDSVTSIGEGCFAECSSLTSVVIPDSVTSIGASCFYGCSSLIDYELYWRTQPVTYDSAKMPVNNGTVFTIPQGTTSIYTDAGYPSNNLVERGETLTLTCDKPIIQKTETSTVTATLKQSGSPLTGKTLNYQVKHGSTVISSGTKTTNGSGQATISYVGTGVGDVKIIVKHDALQETFVVEDCLKYYPLTDNTHESAFTIPSGVVSSYSSDGWRMSANAYKQVKLTEKLTSPCTVEFTITDYNSTSEDPSVVVYQYTNGETTPNQVIMTSRGGNLNSECLGQSIGHKFIKNAVYKIEFDSTMKVYENDVLVASASNTVGLPTRFEWHMGANNRYAVYKDLKVKALPEKEPDNLTLSSATPIIQKDDTATINATLTHNDVAVSGKTLNYFITHDNNGVLNILDSGSVVTGSDGKASISYTGTGVGDVSVEVSYGTLLQKTFVVEDCIFYSKDGTGLQGTYTTSSDATYSYITNIKDDVKFPTLTYPTNFVFSMKHYAGGTDSWGNALWLIGSDASNGLLIGAERSNCRLRIYNWSNGSASVQQTRNDSFSANTWYDLEIEYNNGVWTDKANGYSISYSKSFTPTIIKNYSETRYSRLCEIKIKAL